MTDERTKILTIAHVPSELANEWLQHLRDFDVAHPGSHFEVIVDGPEMPFSEMIDTLRINPGLSLYSILERKKPS